LPDFARQLYYQEGPTKVYPRQEINGMKGNKKKGILSIVIGLTVLSSRSQSIKRFLKHLEERYPHHHRQVWIWQDKIKNLFIDNVILLLLSKFIIIRKRTGWQTFKFGAPSSIRPSRGAGYRSGRLGASRQGMQVLRGRWMGGFATGIGSITAFRRDF
jgi:hypothetical protein